VAAHIGSWVCSSHAGSPLSVIDFMTGGMVSQAVA
jgi:hypothetical protein